MLGLNVQVHLFEELVGLLQGLVFLLEQLAIVVEVVDLRFEEADFDIELLVCQTLLNNLRLQLMNLGCGLILIWLPFAISLRVLHSQELAQIHVFVVFEEEMSGA